MGTRQQLDDIATKQQESLFSANFMILDAGKVIGDNVDIYSIKCCEGLMRTRLYYSQKGQKGLED